MKIGIVCPYNMFRGGGVQECVLALQTGLQKLGHEVKIITPMPRTKNHNSDYKDMLFVGGATDIKSPFHTTAQISAVPKNEVIDGLLEREKFDILHFHEPWVPMFSRQILSRCHCATVATFHAKLPETVMTRTIERVITPYTRSVLKYLDGLTAVSEAASLYIKSLTTQPVTIIPNGIELGTFSKSPSRPAGNTIFYIGRLEKRKGLKYLLKAFAQLAERKPDARLLIAGDGPDREKLEIMVQERRIPRVSFLGFVDESQKLRLLREADIFCSPALYGESFGIVLLEAMAMGVVTVAGNNPGYATVMKDFGRLSLVNPKDTDEFANRLQLLLEDETLRSDWRAWAASYVKQFSYDTVVPMYEAFYKKTLQHHKTHTNV